MTKKFTSALSFLLLAFFLGCSGDSENEIRIFVNDILTNPSKASITVGETQQLSRAIAPADATEQTVTWSSDNTSIAIVNEAGLVTGIAAGTTSITASAKDGSNKTAHAVITVTPGKIPVTSLAINTDQPTIFTGVTQQLSSVIDPADATDKTIMWSSSNTNIAVVNASGLVTGVAAGTTTISVAAKDGSNKTAQVSITVTVAPMPRTTDVLTSFKFNNHTYYIIKQAKNWVDAAAYAVHYGGYLVEIDNEEEQIEIRTKLEGLTGDPFSTLTKVRDGGDAKYLWIGATDTYAEGTWVWDGDRKGATTPIGKGAQFDFASNPGAYVNWGLFNQGEPDNFQSNQDAAAIAVSNSGLFSWSNGFKYQWNDIAASNTTWFIMEANY